MDIRDRILAATLRVYAETGYRGATTRRIAQEARVNEITLFRHFGSKDALIQAALHCADGGDLPRLPAQPVDPERELGDWCRARFEAMQQSRSLIRKLLGEIEEHPEVAAFARRGPAAVHQAVSDYLRRLQATGLAREGSDVDVAATMLMNALFTEAISRDVIPECYPTDVDTAITAYVRLLLRAVGARDAKPVAANHRSARTHRSATERPHDR